MAIQKISKVEVTAAEQAIRDQARRAAAANGGKLPDRDAHFFRQALADAKKRSES